MNTTTRLGIQAKVEFGAVSRRPGFFSIALIAILALGTASTAAAQDPRQRDYRAPRSSKIEESAARAALVTWIADSNGPSEQSLYFRNTSIRPVEITTYEYTKCINISGVKCGVVHEPALIIPPGETVVLQVVRQRDRQQGYSYWYEFTARFGSALREEAPDKASHAGAPSAVAIPDVLPVLKNESEIREALRDYYPRPYRRSRISGTVVVMILVDEKGRVAETRVYEPSRYEAFNTAVEKVSKRQVFEPATLRGKPVATWILRSFEFEPR